MFTKEKENLLLITITFLWQRLLTHLQGRRAAPVSPGLRAHCVTEINVLSDKARKPIPVAIQTYHMGVWGIRTTTVLQRAQSSSSHPAFFSLYQILWFFFHTKLQENGPLVGRYTRIWKRSSGLPSGYFIFNHNTSDAQEKGSAAHIMLHFRFMMSYEVRHSWVEITSPKTVSLRSVVCGLTLRPSRQSIT